VQRQQGGLSLIPEDSTGPAQIAATRRPSDRLHPMDCVEIKLSPVTTPAPGAPSGANPPMPGPRMPVGEVTESLRRGPLLAGAGAGASQPTRPQPSCVRLHNHRFTRCSYTNELELACTRTSCKLTCEPPPVLSHSVTLKMISVTRSLKPDLRFS